jgi:hypothetical protein
MPYEFDAKYKIEPTPQGCKFTFFCGVSGVAVYTTDPICAEGEQAALAIAKQESRVHFNRCEQCGKWIGDSVYNIDEAKCVLCAPFAAEPRYCPECGRPVKAGGDHCARCGAKSAQRASV